MNASPALDAELIPGGRLLLRPGAVPVRRDDAQLQVGVDAPARALLPDRPDVRRLLDDLRHGTATTHDPRVAHVVRSLVDAGLALDALPVEQARRAVPRSADATFAAHGPDAARRLEARARAVVSIEAIGDVDVTVVCDLLAASGVTVGHDAASPADVRLLVAAGPVPRERCDPLVAGDAAHLVLEGLDGTLRLGPFVQPGLTACLRCVDAHLAERDPRRPLVVDQLASRLAAPASAPVDPLLLTWLLAWAAHDVVRYLDGEEPSTWSATVTVGGAHLPVAEPRTRHPECGCSWDQALP